jgi:hypothetical protein
MIKGLSTQSTEPNIEVMFVFGNHLGEDGINLSVHIYYNELTPEQQAVYDDALNLVDDKYVNIINNTTSNLTINRVTSTVLTEGEDVLDFESLSETDKDKLRALLALFVELNS